MSSSWRLTDIPDQTGRTIVVTGTTVGGLGHFTALELARRGARVVLAGRTASKIAATESAIRAEVPAASLEQLSVDLSDLGSVRSAAAAASSYGPIDVLVNNAGVMGTSRTRTGDGLELQLATNHFGPFLLTGLLLPQLVASGDARVVVVSSQFHRYAKEAPLGDPRQQTGRYDTWRTYGSSKLANLLFTYELDRRTREAGLPVEAMAAHPGFAGTHLAANGQYGRSSGGIASILDATVKAVSQSAAAGAWPTLMAATGDLPGGTYCGPSGPAQMAGAPQVVTSNRASRDPASMRRLWEISEETTGIRFP
ncbi:putative short-chain dehydrogenase/reductase [Nocardioides psychrotolerans]|uniref:Short-chain dehydrogenase n=1 Tax=Nocardioides psychrotolerans TaxID=1005945 RepID=A0A1I3R6C4_9ACTN|nr:oxidoreductase [Nocardioides psychrotolerans]GEP40317.1 putative short-chain dehydrogenase/reductase [Nocardioides psychrotolerans]SFJ40806.1 Short-chain dehydrogenase [Nocardioides psychrotolerans]